jgi:hypothetical protein
MAHSLLTKIKRIAERAERARNESDGITYIMLLPIRNYSENDPDNADYDPGETGEDDPLQVISGYTLRTGAAVFVRQYCPLCGKDVTHAAAGRGNAGVLYPCICERCGTEVEPVIRRVDYPARG